MKIKLLNIFGLLLLFNTAFSQVAKEDVKEYTLKNGLKVFLCEDHSTAEVFGYIATKAGSKEDPKDAEGIAHYLEHMMFKGSEDFGTTNWEKEKPIIDEIFSLYEELRQIDDVEKEKEIQKKINELSINASEYTCQSEFDNIIKSMGGTGLNANTNWDRTVFFNTFPSTQIEKWLEVYYNRFSKPVFREFQAELEVVFEEKNMSLDNPMSVLRETLFSNLYEGHEYGRTVLGRVEHLKKPSLNKMKKFYESYYVPNNMCLILSGDINPDKIMPIIEKKFGSWKKVELPKETITPLKPFNKRQELKVQLTPYKTGVLAYRTVAANHEDELALSFIKYLLSNSNQTGLINKLVIDKKIQGGSASLMSLNDHGSLLIDYTPKIDNAQSTFTNLVQESFKATEKKIIKEIEKVKSGDFPDWMIESAKNEFKKIFKLRFESNSGKANFIGEAFQSNLSYQDLILYPNKVDAITKEKIISVAKKYLGTDYLALNSTKGKPDNDKISKPEFKPVKPKAGNKSEYSKKIAEMPVSNIQPKYVDFKNDIKIENIKDKIKMYYSNNKKNDIFNLSIKYGVGEHEIPNLKYAAMLMNYAGTLKRDVNALKEEFGKIACSYEIYCDNNSLNIEITGVDKNLPQALKLFTELLLAPKLEQDMLEILINRELRSRYSEKNYTSSVSAALREYIKYDQKSNFIDRLSLEKLKELDAGYLVGDYQKATSYEVEVHYCGSKSFEEAKKDIEGNLVFKSDLKPKVSLYTRKLKDIEQDEVFFVHDKDAVQSSIYLLVNGEPFTNVDFVNSSAFNHYFGGGFSGIVTQEIRENKSLAYGAGASYVSPFIPGENAYLTGVTSTQADKTVEAVKTFVELVKNMPEKPERIDAIKGYLIQSSKVNKPYFRYLTHTVNSWERWGFNEDPNKARVEKYNTLIFKDIVDFYKTNIQGKPIAICLVGNKSNIDMKALKSFIKVTSVSKSKMFK